MLIGNSFLASHYWLAIRSMPIRIVLQMCRISTKYRVFLRQFFQTWLVLNVQTWAFFTATNVSSHSRRVLFRCYCLNGNIKLVLNFYEIISRYLCTFLSQLTYYVAYVRVFSFFLPQFENSFISFLLRFQPNLLGHFSWVW